MRNAHKYNNNRKSDSKSSRKNYLTIFWVNPPSLAKYSQIISMNWDIFSDNLELLKVNRIINDKDFLEERGYFFHHIWRIWYIFSEVYWQISEIIQKKICDSFFLIFFKTSKVISVENFVMPSNLTGNRVLIRISQIAILILISKICSFPMQNLNLRLLFRRPFRSWASP